MRALIRSRRVALPLAALAIAGTGLAAYGATTSDAVNYRTVVAGVGDVDQVLALNGVVESTGRSDLAFGTDGAVARVPVAQGDVVEKGDVLAVLDRSDLRAAVDKARSDLAAARVQLADDRAAQTSAVETASTSASTGNPATPARDNTPPKATESPKPSGTPTPAPVSPVLEELKAQQDAVIAAQSAASAALATAATALTTQEQACVVASPEPTGEPTDGTTDDVTDGSEEPGGVSEACTTALAAVQSAQSATGTAQSALQAALEELGGTLTVALRSLEASDEPDAPEEQQQEPADAAPDVSQEAATPDSESSGGPAARTVTAATLASDQAAIDRATAALAAAKVAHRAGVVRAPADGKVVSLSVAPGDEVASGDAVAVVVAPGLTAVSLEVTAAQAAQLAPGTEVEVTPAGATEALAGSISRVENVPVSDAAEGSDPTYPVEVVLDERDLGLPDGIPASVAVLVGSAADVVTVPASAVVDGTVTVLRAGVAQRVRVTTGIVGSTEVEVLDGIDAGDEVVLADLDADLPSADTDDEGPQRIQFGGGGPQFGGGGPPVGGAPGR